MSAAEEREKTAAAVRELGALPMPVGPQMPPFPPAPRTFEEKLRADVARLQGLLAEAVAEKHRALRERDLMRERVSEPFGCALCGVEKRSHGRRYIGGAGMHTWERPSDEQVKARMLARRVARSPLPATPELDLVEEELTGVSLSLFEEEQTSARLRLALESAKRGRRELRSSLQFAEPSRERWRAATIEVTRERDELRARVAELEKRLHDAAMTRVWTNEDGKRFVFVEDIAPALLNLPSAPTQALREDEPAESSPRFVVRELGPRCFAVDDTETALSYDMRFTRTAAQRAADRRNERQVKG